MSELLLTLGGAIIGALFSWPIAHWYYRRSLVAAPEWAKPLILKLPDAPVSEERLIELFRFAVESGVVQKDSIELPTGTVCPECKVSAYELRPLVDSDPRDVNPVRGFECMRCGYITPGFENFARKFKMTMRPAFESGHCIFKTGH